MPRTCSTAFNSISRQFSTRTSSVSFLVEGNGFEVLHIDYQHAAALIDLPMHHRDPFDRLLVAQAMVENTPIVSNDP